MPTESGNGFIDGASGKPSPDSGAKPADGNEKRTDEPEILYGFDVEGPAVDRIDTGTDTGTGSARRTKSGRPDRRTRAGRESTGADPVKKENLLSGSKISLEKLLYSLHLMGAQVIKELEIDEEESKKLAEAINEVNKFYNIPIDPKKLAIINLLVVMFTIYCFRLIAIRNRLKQAKAALPAPGPREVPKQAAPSPSPKPVPTGTGKVDFGIESGAI